MTGRAFIAAFPKIDSPPAKDLSIQIEQDSSKIRHDLARFRRRATAASNCPIIADLSPRLHRHLRGPKNYAALAAIFLSIFD